MPSPEPGRVPVHELTQEPQQTTRPRVRPFPTIQVPVRTENGRIGTRSTTYCRLRFSVLIAVICESSRRAPSVTLEVQRMVTVVVPVAATGSCAEWLA